MGRRMPATHRDDISPSEWAYAAGIMDGEGSMCVYQEIHDQGRRVRWHVELRVSNTSLAMLEWMLERFGGLIQECHDRMRRERGWKRCYTWSSCGRANGEWFVRGILPYLVTKQREAGLLLEFWSGVNSATTRKVSPEERARRCDVVSRMRELKTHNHKCKALV
jgi:hypothetical protein